MSRIGKKGIQLPPKTTVEVAGGMLKVTGPAGTITRALPAGFELATEGALVTLVPKGQSESLPVLWGTYTSHMNNMVKGVNKPYEKRLVVEGIGFKYDIKGDSITFNLGFSHPITLKIPQGLKVTSDKQGMLIAGVDKELVGQFASKVKSLKKPEPYKGKGIRYAEEVIRRKQGKKTT